MNQKNQNIGVSDWFTKKIKEDIDYPEQSNKTLDVFINDIIGILDNSKKLSDAADDIYDKLEKSEFINNICSDSRFPICSLFHHMKNTSAVATCILFQNIAKDKSYLEKCLKEYDIKADYAEKDLVSLLRIAALLHDIGKPRSSSKKVRYGPYYHHTTQTREILEHILENTSSNLVEKYELNKIVPKLAAQHHSRDTSTKLERLLSKADTVASAADRINEIDSNLENGNLHLESKDKIFPHEINCDAGNLKCLEKNHTTVLGNGSTIDCKVEIKDPTANSAQLFYDSVCYGGPVKYLGKPYPISGNIGILSLDVMGIQGFIGEADKLNMLRGGSYFVDKVLEAAKDVIALKVCPEAVLFWGGGNLLSFIPATEMYRKELKETIENKVKDISNDGLQAAVITFEEELANVAGQFNDTLEKSQNELETRKNETRSRQPIKNTKNICEDCAKRPEASSGGSCKVCKEKEEKGKLAKCRLFNKYIKNTHDCSIPTELSHLGESIGALVIDGNMMGRLFQQTSTPAEYTYKSHTFKTKFDKILEDSITTFLDQEENLNLVKHRKEGIDYLGIDVLYAGGDDVLILMNAKAVIQFASHLIENVSEEFMFKKKFYDTTTFENPTVTISCGIAIADNSFPIYFLLDAAREMESSAKKKFRQTTSTDDYNIIKIPKGAMSVTAISSAMPGKDHISFVFPHNLKDFEQLSRIFAIAFYREKSRTLISDLVTCGNSKHERLNLIKYMYSSVQRKSDSINIDDCEWMADTLCNDNLLSASRMIIPHLLHGEGE